MKKYFKIILSVFITLAIAACDMDDDSLNVDLEGLAAPSDLGATFQITQDNSGVVTIIPTGSGATQYSVDFGDGSPSADEIKPGETVTHVYAEGDYDVVVTGTNLAGKTGQGTQPLTVSFRQPENLEVVISKGTDGYSVTVSASADYAAMFEVYFGEVEAEDPTPLMIGESVTHTYAEIGTYDIKVVALSGGSATVEYTETVEMTGPVPAPTPNKLPESVISLFSNAYTNVPVDMWITDWSQAELEETDIEGNDVKKYSNLNFVGVITESTQIDATGMTHFRTDIFSLDAETFRVKLVDFGPDGAWQGGDDVEHEVVFENIPQGEWVTLDIPLEDFTGLTTRANISQLIYSAAPAGETTVLVDNVFFYDDRVQVPTSPVMAAPTPVHVEADVQSIFSDKYTDPAGVNYFPNWGQTTTYEMVSINGNSAIKYGNANYEGIDIGESLNLTGFDYVHIDVWSGDYTSIPFFLIAPGPIERSVTLDLMPNQWNSIQIPLSEFTSQGLDVSDIFQFKFDVTAAPGGTFYIDNLYFSSASNATTVTLPVTFENSSLTYSLLPFEGAETAIEANPYPGGINPSSTVVKFTKTVDSQPWAGATLELEAPIDFSSTTKISVKVYSPKAGIPVLMKLENSNDNNIKSEVSVVTSKENQWEELVFDFSTVGIDTAQEFGKVIMFFEFGDGSMLPGDGTVYYYDDIQLIN
ncbi:PKD domain-containing protein [Salinimicrobium gaetbulicola]|uniref:PKD domain-containing protein n=1 Tax=Salinimicrobium gaetbulicola TaxID=999702 RepID=A0ABW3IG96_9FLAO